jgi:hypothetical protein
MKVTEDFNSSTKKRPPLVELVEGKSQPRQKALAKDFTFDYNGSKYNNLKDSE